MRRVWSRNLVNEENVARVGPQRHKKKRSTHVETDVTHKSHVDYMDSRAVNTAKQQAK